MFALAWWDRDTRHSTVLAASMAWAAKLVPLLLAPLALVMDPLWERPRLR